jgi:hypothetical protein
MTDVVTGRPVRVALIGSGRMGSFHGETVGRRPLGRNRWPSPIPRAVPPSTRPPPWAHRVRTPIRQLVSTRTLSSGVVILTYTPATMPTG